MRILASSILFFYLTNFFKIVLLPEVPKQDSLIANLRVWMVEQHFYIKEGYFNYLCNLYSKLELTEFTILNLRTNNPVLIPLAAVFFDPENLRVHSLKRIFRLVTST